MGYVDKTLNEFTEILASPAPTPGGGGAAALMGAIGISLGDMVGELTVGKKKYAEVEEEIKLLMDKAQDIRKDFLRLIDEDAECFEPLAKAYGIPKDEPGRDEIMEEALKTGASVPMEIMRTCGRALEVVKEFGEKGSRLAISDAGCAAICCKSAIMSASLNVYINTKAMKDREYAELINVEAGALLAKYEKMADEIFDGIASGLKG